MGGRANLPLITANTLFNDISIALNINKYYIGSIIYRIIVALVLQMGLNTDDLKLLTAILVGIALTIPIMLSKRKQISMYKKLTKEIDENA